MGIMTEIADCVSTSIAKSATERRNMRLHPDGRRKTRTPLPAATTGMVRAQTTVDPDRSIIIYEPPEVTQNVTVCWFHGGGYFVGTPQSMAIGADLFNARGYRFVSMGYGLFRRELFPAQVDDAFLGVRMVLDWLDDNGHLPGIVVGGNSAGGLNAGMVAYDRISQERYGIDASRIHGVITLAGVLDMYSMLTSAGRSGSLFLRRYTTLPDAEATRRFSPIEFLGDKSVTPILCIHGRHDSTVPCSSSIRFVDKLNTLAKKRAGAVGPVDDLATLHLIEDPRYQHIRLTAGVFTEDPAGSDVLQTVFGWLDRLS